MKKNGMGLSISLVALLLAFPWLTVTLIANMSIVPKVSPTATSGPPVTTGGSGSSTLVVEPSLIQGSPSLSTLAIVGGVLSLVGALIIWRYWRQRRDRKEDYFWVVEKQQESPLGSLILLGLLAVSFYGLFLLVRANPTFSIPEGRPVAIPDILPYLAVAAVVASSAIGLGLFLSLRGVPGHRPKAASSLPEEEIDQERFVEVINQTARALGHGSDFRATIVSCYREICQILGREGKTDSSRLTAREFEALVASKVRVDEGNLHEATLLFEKARYSVDPIYDEDAKRAEVCLQKLVTDVQPRRTIGITGVQRS